MIRSLLHRLASEARLAECVTVLQEEGDERVRLRDLVLEREIGVQRFHRRASERRVVCDHFKMRTSDR